jgi:hypothetical protein
VSTNLGEGQIDDQSDPPQLYIQFRFILFGHWIGDWDDRVPIVPLQVKMDKRPCRFILRIDWSPSHAKGPQKLHG